MFESLTDKLTGIFNRLSSKGRLTEKDIDDALAQVRRSLLEADVNFRVAPRLCRQGQGKVHGLRRAGRA